MFIWAKILWAIFTPSTLLVLAVVVATGLLWFGERARRWGRRILTFVAAFILALLVLPLEKIYLAPLEQRFLPPDPMPSKVDGIIALGGALSVSASQNQDLPALTDAADRITTLLVLAERYPAAKLVFSSGGANRDDQSISEADLADDLLERMGLPEERLILERKSRNTYENALYSKALAHPQPGETWLLITSAIHMPRSVAVFRAQDWPVLPYPVDHLILENSLLGGDLGVLARLEALDRATKEWVGLLAYWLNDWTEEFFPEP